MSIGLWAAILVLGLALIATGRARRSRWLRALLVWTILIGLLMIGSLPGALAPTPPCIDAGNPDPNPNLPMCGVDEVNVDDLVVFLLALLWVAGFGVWAVALVASRSITVLRRARE